MSWTIAEEATHILVLNVQIASIGPANMMTNNVIECVWEHGAQSLRSGTGK